MIESQYFTIPLRRHSDYVAHVREKDYSLIFSKKTAELAEKPDFNDTKANQDLFLKYGNLIAERQPRHLGAEKKKKTFTTYLILTDSCNLNCIYCDVLSNQDYQNYGKKMTWEVAKTALDVIASRLEADPSLYAQVTFFGGEPLINLPVLKRICEYIETMDNRDRIDRMIVTNGTLIKRETAEFLLKHKVYVVVSIDGLPSSNNIGRVTHRGQGAYQATEKGLDILKEVMPKQFGLSCTLGSHNAENLAEQIEYLHKRFNPVSIGINMYHYRQDGGCPIKVDEQLLIHSQLEALKVCRREGIAIYQYVGLLKSFITRQRNQDYCPACIDKILYLPEGRVGRCETMVFNDQFNFPIEMAVKNQMPEILDWTKYTPTHEPACQTCEARWICAGSCPYDQYITTGSLNGVEERRCNFHKKFLYELLDLVLDAVLEEEKPEAILIPAQKHFNYIAGNIPMSFPKDTIYITGTGPVYETESSK